MTRVVRPRLPGGLRLALSMAVSLTVASGSFAAAQGPSPTAGAAAPSAPAASSAPALPSAPALDPAIAAVFPTLIAGQEIQTSPLPGSVLFGLVETSAPTQAQAFADFLTTSGKTVDDLFAVIGIFQQPEGGTCCDSLLALRVDGLTAAELLEQIKGMNAGVMADPRVDTATYAGKQVTIVSDGPPDGADTVTYIYPAGDVLFSYNTNDDKLAISPEDVFAALP